MWVGLLVFLGQMYLLHRPLPSVAGGVRPEHSFKLSVSPQDFKALHSCCLINRPCKGEARVPQEVLFGDRNIEAPRIFRLLVLRQERRVAAIQLWENIVFFNPGRLQAMLNKFGKR